LTAAGKEEKKKRGERRKTRKIIEVFLDCFVFAFSKFIR
jgi:hypothetical protein